MTANPPVKAIALFSGGLDSLIAVRLMSNLGFDVTALTFMTHFGCSAGLDGGSCGHDPHKFSEMTGIRVKLCHLGQDFINIVRTPKFGHGKNMNPCVDCRILMLRQARDYMETVGAPIVFTGEVLGQRPMSQRIDMFNVIDREAGLIGRVLRPLSARLLRPTIPETEGIVDRTKLFGIAGRSRKEQMRLAAEWNIQEYPTPSGGCLLTDPGYSNKLYDLSQHLAPGQERVTDIQLLQLGRHLRLSERFKIVVGRNQEENALLEGLFEPGDWWIEAVGHKGPVVHGRGTPTDAELTLAARITAHYSRAPKGLPTRVHLKRLGHETEQELEVIGVVPTDLEQWRMPMKFTGH